MKTVATDPKLRIVSAISVLSTLYEAAGRVFCGRAEASKLNLISTVNLLGFSMLCHFPDHTDRLLLERLRRMQTVSMMDIIKRLLGGIDYYGSLTGMQDRLVHFIMLEIPGSEINGSMLFYLRIACALRDPSFFSWVLDKNPLFSIDVCLGASPLDSRLGLDLWIPFFERRLNIFGSVFRGFRNLPERVSPQFRGTATADEWKLVMSIWNSWLHNRAVDRQAEYEIVNPSILALYSIRYLEGCHVLLQSHFQYLDSKERKPVSSTSSCHGAGESRSAHNS
jgi:hypothetical protein